MEYTKQTLQDDALIPQLTPPFFPSPYFHLLYHDVEATGPLKRLLSKHFEAYASRWKGASCNQKPIDPQTNQPYAFECYNYTLIGMRVVSPALRRQVVTFASEPTHTVL